MRRLVFGALCLGLLVPVATAFNEGDDLDPIAGIRAQEFLAHVKWLSDDARGGRLSGSENERAATQYVADRFIEWGLKPAGEDGTFFQYFPVPKRMEAGPANRLTIGDRTLTAGTDFRPIGSSPTASATGRLVFVGYGVSDAVYDDYKGIDCVGAVAVAIRCTAHSRPPGVEINGPGMFLQNMLTQRQIQSAQNAGAAALILIPSTGNDHEIGVVSGGGRLARFFSRNPTTIPVAVASRAAIAPVLAAKGIALEPWELATQEAKAPGERPELGVEGTLATEVLQKEFQGRNVIGYLEGSDPTLKAQFVVIGAHADHVGRNEAGNATDGNNEIHNGADDNASGTAGMLELAQAFATCAIKPRRSMLFMAFSGEELGLLGSRHWVKNPTRPLSDVVAMINLDMIGRSQNNRVTAEAAQSSPGFQALCEKHNQAVGVDLKFTKGVRGDSDHASFYAGGVPVIFFFTGLHEDYHKSTDDWDKINAGAAEKTLRLAYLVAAEITANDARPEYYKIPTQARPGRQRGGNRVRLGIMPAYGEDIRGAKVERVIEGTPAAKAGIQDGDVIVRIGEMDIANMQDLTVALGNQKPGDTVEFIVQRKDAKLTLKVTFEGR